MKAIALCRGPGPGALLLALVLLCSACSPSPQIVVALDEAFVALRPGLAAALARQKQRGYRLEYAELPLAGGASELAGLLAASAAPPFAIVVSPLLARALLEGAERNKGEPGQAAGAAPGPLRGAPLLALAWPLAPRPGLLALVDDPLPAYGAAGRALGAQVAAYRAAGEAGAAGAILFSEGPSRPQAALGAFEAAFEGAAGFPPLVRILGGNSGEEGAGSSPAAAKLSEAGPAGGEAPGQDLSSVEPAAAEAAVRELLGSEIRVLLVAAGEAGPAAARAAEGPGRAIGLAGLQGAAVGGASFLLAPDDRAAARAVLAEAISAGRAALVPAAAQPPGLAPPGSGSGLSPRALPYRLLALPPAREFEVGGKSLAQRLSEASLRP